MHAYACINGMHALFAVDKTSRSDRRLASFAARTYFDDIDQTMTHTTMFKVLHHLSKIVFDATGLSNSIGAQDR
jgi:hypothetical protein